jgi:hypothetical protein
MHTHGGHVARFATQLRHHPPVLAQPHGDRSFHDAFRGKAGRFDAALQAADVLHRDRLQHGRELSSEARH